MTSKKPYHKKPQGKKPRFQRQEGSSDTGRNARTGKEHKRGQGHAQAKSHNPGHNPRQNAGHKPIQSQMKEQGHGGGGRHRERGRHKGRDETDSVLSPGSKRFWICGRHACLAALKNKQRQVERILVSTAMQEEIAAVAKGRRVELATGEEIGALVGRDVPHQGVALLVDRLADAPLETMMTAPVLLVLDQITDPHNVGAILRSAAAFGAGGVIMHERHSAPETAVMAKAASGALETVPIHRCQNISQLLEELKTEHYWCIGLDGATPKRLHEVHKFEKVALVLGAEGAGMRRMTAENCDMLVSIPINDAMESLNVSNAAAVALYELARNRA